MACLPEGKEYQVYKNANMSIFFTDYCNACCRFCIEQVEYRSRREMLFEKPHILDKINYLKRLDYILDYIRPLNTSLSITGGEPTMSPYFADVLKIVKNTILDCTTEMLHEIIPKLIQNNVRPRINCVLVKGYINSIADMVSFLEYYMKLGIDNVVFLQMMEYNPVYVKNEEIVKFYAERLMTIDELWQQMDLDERFTKKK